MMPELADGDFVIISWYFWSLKIKDLIVVNHPKYHRIIKRIKSISYGRKYYLEGSNTASVSSEEMGWISKRDIVGKVVLKITRSK